MKQPKPGGIYEKNGFRRLVVSLNMLGKRPDSDNGRAFDGTVWSRYWHWWAGSAKQV